MHACVCTTTPTHTLLRFNGQGIEGEPSFTVHTRHMLNEHYIKAVLLHGRLYGCILVGETGLEVSVHLRS